MDTMNHKNRQYSASQNACKAYCFAPEKRLRGAYFGVDNILLTILQHSQQEGSHYSLVHGESPPLKREKEGFCKEKEKLFANYRGSPPLPLNENCIEILKLRKDCTDFSDFVVLKFRTPRRQIW